ncbi:MAG: YitT family protein [Clostridia bacterium]
MDYKLVKKRLKLKKYAYEMLLLIMGCFIMACGTSFFLLPNQLSSGGFAGIATITYYFLSIPLGTAMLILNIPLLIISYFRVGKEFVVKSLIGTVVLAGFIDILDKFPALTQDRFLGCVYGGIAMGIGTALVLKSVSSTGGTDLLSYIIQSYRPHYRASSLIMSVDIVIISLNVLFFRDIEVGLYSAIAIYLMGKMIDIIFEGVYFTKMMFIISEKYEEIAQEIGEKVDRGSTGIYAKGMYTNQDKMMLLCVGSRNEVSKIKNIAVSVDNKAFIIISNAREAWGKGFKKG